MVYSYLVLIPLIAGIGEVFRLAGVPCKYIPFINLVIGVVLGLILCYSNSKACLVDGLFIGLSASGFTRSSKEIRRLFISSHLSDKLNKNKNNEHDESENLDIYGVSDEDKNNLEEEFKDDE